MPSTRAHEQPPEQRRTPLDALSRIVLQLGILALGLYGATLAFGQLSSILMPLVPYPSE